MVNYNEVLRYFPEKICILIDKELKQNDNNYAILEEIRFRNNKPIILKFNNFEKIIEYIINTEEILEILQNICQNSIYSYQNQICNRIYNYKRWT